MLRHNPVDARVGVRPLTSFEPNREPVPSSTARFARSMGRFMSRWSFRHAIALVIVATTACASRGELTTAPLARGGETVIGTGYRFIAERFIRAVPVRQIALSGLKGLTLIDPKVRAEERGGSVVVRHNGKIIALFDRPGARDLRGWARVTVRAFQASKKVSVKIRNAPSEEVYRVVFGSTLASLDRYSRYSTAAEARDSRAWREGYGGIGITIRSEKGLTRIITVMPGSPGQKAGLKDNDVIIAIAGVAIRKMNLRNVVRRLRGPRGSRVLVTVRRTTRKRPLTVAVTRRFIIPHTVISRREGDAIYIRLTRFSSGTARKTAQAVARWRARIGQRKFSGVILDLRNNPGGLLDQSITVSDLFLNSGSIVYTKGRHPESFQQYAARRGDILGGKPVVVLVNGRSASSSEIVAAALQDNGRAVVVGSNSFGKGTVQSVASLPNQGEMILTWSHFHAPSGYTLQGLGVRPNICTSMGARNARSAVSRLIEGKTAGADVFRSWRRYTVPPVQVAKALRAGCPPRALAGPFDVELEIARRLLTDQGLYDRALAASTRGTARPTARRTRTGNNRAAATTTQ